MKGGKAIHCRKIFNLANLSILKGVIEMNLQVFEKEEFINLPVSTRCLYYELLHNSDDENICTKVGTSLKRGKYPYGDLELL